MEKTLTEVCEYLNNYFWRSKIQGKFTIENGSISVTTLKAGQYFRIVGSVFNDGVHIYPASNLTNEVFEGSIWSMAIPQTVIDLALEVKDWQDKYGSVGSEAMSPYTSESFGNYSYSKGTSTGDGAGNPNGWQSVYASRLAPYRRLRGMP